MKFKSIRTKILLSSLVLFAILLSSFFIIYYISLSHIKSMTISSMESSVEKSANDMNNLLKNMENVAEMVALDSEIQKSLRLPLPETKQDIFKQRLEYNQKILYMKQFSNQIDGIFVLGENGSIFRGSNKSLREEEYRNFDWYKKVVKENESLWIEPNNPSLIIKNLNKPTLSLVFPIQDRISPEIIGVVVVEVLTSTLNDIFIESTIYKGNIYIVNENGNISYSNQENIEEAISLEKIKYEKEDFISKKQIDSNNWELIGFIKKNIVFSELYNIRNNILIIFIIVAIISCTYIWFSANKLTKPIKRIIKNMKIVEKGNFNISLEVESEDEMGVLTTTFNHMVYTIKELIEKEKQQQILLETAELNALQSQINPHFLYNTLDSINWMARLNRLDVVSDMIEALTTVFRVSLSKGKVLIPVKDELSHVEEYMKIQKYRYGDKINFEIDVAEKLLDYTIVKIIFQPLVENSLYHGLININKRGDIKLIGKEYEDKLVFIVEDNGLGMTKEKLKEINNHLKDGIDIKSSSYGIINVQRRLQMTFGEEYGLKYESEIDKGTKVYIELPKIKEN
ncbi:cache domain-containing sensor histidine kinase [Miniphocaeibacter halophilus]|uniref:Sensor histidine kinase n=1 Tax=Miniphocaeibacter halophilus TaxID=2931922 RepID=A0AC61MQA7_9FIRM|nr:sensor histidine kinase [Miniphocaeibacter halophilus]QQK07791.1 sensor histidine kinase [Miniphocaeibacter halophilus]